MFYANFILKKRGPLSRIWLAAHWDKKLTKAHIFETDIEGSVTAMLSPELKLALRTSSHLLLGVVRVYSRKTKYLLADCNEALVKIKLAFRPGVVDLPAENREASLATINIREDFTSFDLDVTDFNEVDFHARFSVNQSRPEDITLREEVACVEFIGDDDFVDSDKIGGPTTVEAVDLFLDKLGSANYGRLASYFKCIDMSPQTTDRVAQFLATPRKMARNTSLADSGVGSPSVWLESVNPSFGEASRSPTKGFGDFGFNPDMNTMPEMILDDLTFEQNAIETESLQEHENGLGKEDVGITNESGQFGSPSAGDDYDEHYYENGGGDYDDDDDDLSLPNNKGRDVGDRRLFSEETILNQKERPLCKEFPEGGSSSRAKLSLDAENLKENTTFIDKSLASLNCPSKSHAIVSDLTSAMENDTDVFALGPVEVNVKERRAKRKRRLIVDEHKVISSEAMKSQLSDSSDLVTPLDLAPPTKKLMLWKESGGVNRLFVLPGTMLINADLFKLFSKNLLTTSTTDSGDDSGDGDDDGPMTNIAVEEEAANVKNWSPELKQDDVRDSNRDLPSCGDVENTAADDLSPFSPSSGNTSTPKRKSRRLAGAPVDNSPGLPRQSLGDENERGPRTDGSPKRKRRKQQQQQQQQQQPHGSSTKSLELRPLGSNDSGLVSSDPEDVENEDAIFDVGPTPTYGERANLRQELEEAEVEERLWKRRSNHMQHVLHRRLETTGFLSFDQLTVRNNRKQAASKFYTILVLTKARSTNVEQNRPYGDIQITRGPAFERTV